MIMCDRSRACGHGVGRARARRRHVCTAGTWRRGWRGAARSAPRPSACPPPPPPRTMTMMRVTSRCPAYFSPPRRRPDPSYHHPSHHSHRHPHPALHPLNYNRRSTNHPSCPREDAQYLDKKPFSSNRQVVLSKTFVLLRTVPHSPRTHSFMTFT